VSNGVELDINANLEKGFTIIAGYSYNDMRYTKTPDRVGSYVTGQRLVNTPAHTANGSIFYTFEKGALKGLKLGAAAFYVGKRFGGWNDTKYSGLGYSRLIPVDDFATVDVTAGYTFRKLSLLAKVSNLTNTYNYYVHENYSINPIAPRQIIATLSYKF
jgi:iron complex outermembrane receptor protein